jgi:hypothetical protein
MSRVRIYDLAKELKPETKKSLKIARRMGIAGALNVAGPRRRKPPKKGTKKASDSESSGKRRGREDGGVVSAGGRGIIYAPDQKRNHH